jgi:hypothetical protein
MLVVAVSPGPSGDGDAHDFSSLEDNIDRVRKAGEEVVDRVPLLKEDDRAERAAGRR